MFTYLRIHKRKEVLDSIFLELFVTHFVGRKAVYAVFWDFGLCVLCIACSYWTA
jgi:hypothetical protein